MKRSLFLLLAALACAWPALAAVPRVSPSGPFTPGKGKSFIFTTGVKQKLTLK